MSFYLRTCDFKHLPDPKTQGVKITFPDSLIFCTLGAGDSSGVGVLSVKSLITSCYIVTDAPLKNSYLGYLQHVVLMKAETRGTRGDGTVAAHPHVGHK